jgi:hypothetical protein
MATGKAVTVKVAGLLFTEVPPHGLEITHLYVFPLDIIPGFVNNRVAEVVPL